jgi:hypothetical protein
MGRSIKIFLIDLDIPHDVQGVEGKIETAPITVFLKRKEKHLNNIKILF